MKSNRAAVVLLQQDGKVLAVSRKDNHEDLGLPGGKCGVSEATEDAAFREVMEETDLIIANVKSAMITVREDWIVEAFIADFVGTPVSLEGARVEWVEPSRLLEDSCSFRDYNKTLFELLRIL